MGKKILSILLSASILAAVFTGCDTTGSLRVQVVGDGGANLAVAKVVSNTQPQGQLKVTGMTGQDGSVTFNLLKAGDYSFYISVAEYEQKDFTVDVDSGKTTSITISMNRTSPPPSTT